MRFIDVTHIIGSAIKGEHAIEDAIYMCDIMIEVDDVNKRILEVTNQ